MSLSGVNCGMQKLTASGVVGKSGRAIVLYGYFIRSNGTGDGTLSLYDGTSTSGTLMYDKAVQTDESIDNEFPGGITFPNGLYISFLPANCFSYVTVFYQQV